VKGENADLVELQPGQTRCQFKLKHGLAMLARAGMREHMRIATLKLTIFIFSANQAFHQHVIRSQAVEVGGDANR